MKLMFCSFALLLTGIVPAQVTTPAKPTVRAYGDAVVNSRPDQVKVNAGVVTTADTAQASADQNAQKATAVLAALRQLLGPQADIRSVTYSITPNYRTPQGGGPAVVTGYTTTNIFEVTLSDVTSVGRVIDAAATAGANNIQGLRFALKDPNPARLQALQLATAQARANAASMAAGLAMRVGQVISLEDNSAVRPIATTDLRLGAPAAATPTPIESGMVQVSASVVAVFELQ
jgi:uncharacterized protein YggE